MNLIELYDMFNTQFLKSGFGLKDIKSWIEASLLPLLE